MVRGTYYIVYHSISEFIVKILFSLWLLFASSIAMADYHVATFNQTSIENQKPSRILVIGTGDDLGLQFHEVAKAKALRYAQEFSEDQIVVVAIKEKKLNSQWSLERYGFKIIRNEDAKFNADSLLLELNRFPRIKSIDFFSHSTDQFGLHLNLRAYPLNQKTEGLSSLRSRFTPNAFVFLHGCNNGHHLAPFLSRVWNVTVMGSLTATNFQKLHQDENFYLEDAGKQPSLVWQKTNNLSFDKPVNCSQGGCVRMKPENAPYVGYWGEYREGGLPFYKTFCATNSQESCKKAMAESMLTHLSTINLKRTSSFEDYKKAVAEYLCPTNASGTLHKKCLEELENSEYSNNMTYNPFSVKMLQCNEAGCSLEISCKKTLIKSIPKPGSCILKNTADQEANTLVREYRLYLNAFNSL